MSKVAIIGFGAMGSGLTQLFAQREFEVRAADINRDALAKGIELIRNGRFGIEKLLKSGKISRSESEKILGRIRTDTDLGWAVEGAELVIENVDEDLELKKEVFEKLDELCGSDVLLASDTTGLSITSISSRAEHPERIVGMHFFIPAQVMPLVEIISGLMTSSATAQRASQVATDLGKTVIYSKDSPGFTVARLSLSQFIEASSIVEQGIASVKDVDTGVRKGLGFPMGPFELTDLIGLDTRFEILNSMFESTGDPRWKPPLLLRQLVESRYLGDPAIKQGSKGGYYDYFGLPRIEK